MKRNDEIRRLLRGADPAEGRELPPVERARMRAAITRAAFGESTHRRYFAALAVGAALTVAAIAFVAFIRPGEHRAVAIVPSTNEAPVAPALPAPAVAPAAEPVATVVPAPKQRAHERPRVARLDDAGHTTRIVFTGPEGTRILWFVETPDVKELGS